jgi:hypothetical protein
MSHTQEPPTRLLQTSTQLSVHTDNALEQFPSAENELNTPFSQQPYRQTNMAKTGELTRALRPGCISKIAANGQQYRPWALCGLLHEHYQPNLVV